MNAEQLEEWTKAGKKFRRYFDQDGDGIPYRTVPGNRNRMASYFTRGSGHDADARYSEDEHDYKYILDRLRKKFETARKFVPKPIVEKERGVKTGIICYGSSYEPVREARDRLKARGLKTNHMLIRALPLTSEVMGFLGGTRHHLSRRAKPRRSDGGDHQRRTSRIWRQDHQRTDLQRLAGNAARSR